MSTQADGSGGTLQSPRWQRIALRLLVLAWVLAFVGTHIPVAQVPQTGAEDMTLHIVGYGILGLAFVGTLWVHRFALPRRLLVTTLVLAAYGALDELTQPFVNRHASVVDWTGNLIGIGVALLVFEVLVRPVVSRL